MLDILQLLITINMYICNNYVRSSNAYIENIYKIDFLLQSIYNIYK